MMLLHSPEDAMPWVGLYVAVASLICTLAMAADIFQGFRQRKLWFPCRFFTINAVSITLIAITMKLPMDLMTDVIIDESDVIIDESELNVKYLSISFLFIMLSNCLPSLGLMDDKELLMNIVALGILIITIIVNICIPYRATLFPSWIELPVNVFLLLWPISLALTVPASRRVLEHQYKELHRPALNLQEKKFSSKELKHRVKKYWMMAETGNPQFVLAFSPLISALGFICSYNGLTSPVTLVFFIRDTSVFWYGKSYYKWSTNLIVTIQLIGMTVGSIAPTFRCITIVSYFNLSKEWSINYLNMFRVEEHWTQRLQQWKRCHLRSNIPGRHCKIVFHLVKNMILNLCLALQIMTVVICKTICLIPTCFLILFSCCSNLCKSLLKRFKKVSNASNNNVRSEIEEYISYVLQIEDGAKLSRRMLGNTLNSINRILHESEKKQPRNLMKFLEKSISFDGVIEFEDDQVPPLHQEETHNCWSLVAVTLTVVALALPNNANGRVKALLASMSEGLQFVRHIEECLNANGDLVEARKTARRVWTEVEVYGTWLQIDLQKKARKVKTSKEILQWLGDEAVKIVIQFKRCKNGSLDHSFHKFIAASTMYRISQTILLHCNELENWPTDEELFVRISTIIADLLCACFTNLPRVITMKCHHKAIEKREESIRSAAKLLGRSKKILKILKARQLPNLDQDSMAYIDKWHALPKSQIPNSCASSGRIQPASSSSNDSLIVTIM